MEVSWLDSQTKRFSSVNYVDPSSGCSTLKAGRLSIAIVERDDDDDEGE